MSTSRWQVEWRVNTRKRFGWRYATLAIHRVRQRVSIEDEQYVMSLPISPMLLVSHGSPLARDFILLLKAQTHEATIAVFSESEGLSLLAALSKGGARVISEPTEPPSPYIVTSPSAFSLQLRPDSPGESSDADSDPRQLTDPTVSPTSGVPAPPVSSAIDVPYLADNHSTQNSKDSSPASTSSQGASPVPAPSQEESLVRVSPTGFTPIDSVGKETPKSTSGSGGRDRTGCLPTSSSSPRSPFIRDRILSSQIFRRSISSCTTELKDYLKPRLPASQSTWYLNDQDLENNSSDAGSDENDGGRVSSSQPEAQEAETTVSSGSQDLNNGTGLATALGNSPATAPGTSPTTEPGTSPAKASGKRDWRQDRSSPREIVSAKQQLYKQVSQYGTLPRIKGRLLGEAKTNLHNYTGSLQKYSNSPKLEKFSFLLEEEGQSVEGDPSTWGLLQDPGVISFKFEDYPDIVYENQEADQDDVTDSRSGSRTSEPDRVSLALSRTSLTLEHVRHFSRRARNNKSQFFSVENLVDLDQEQGDFLQEEGVWQKLGRFSQTEGSDSSSTIVLSDSNSEEEWDDASSICV